MADFIKKKEKRASRICMHSTFSYNCSAKKEKTSAGIRNWELLGIAGLDV
jgi:hypothetical protein